MYIKYDYNSGGNGMKYFKRLGIYKNSTGSNYYDPQKQEAFSYDWWRYLQNIEGHLVFNNYSYSSTTSQHQHNLLRIIGYKTPKITVYLRNGLNGISSIHDEIERLINENLELKKTILKPRTKKKTNFSRLENIKYNIKQIKKLAITFNLDYTNQINENKALHNELLEHLGSKLHAAFYGV